jgi:NADH-quinone oxidoreductase E subunit
MTTQAHAHAPLTLTPEQERRIEEILGRYPTRRAACIPILHVCQESVGWVSPPVVSFVAQRLGMETSEVQGVVTFYTMYHQHPVGRHFIQVCTTTPCNVCGAEDVVKSLLEHTGCGDLGLTSADGRFTVVEVECLGACGFATPIMINNDFVESVTPESVSRILSELK